MKLKSIIACGLLLLGVGAATTSCEDMFTAENKLVTTDLAPKDTVYQVMGIIQRMQKLADRTVLLGELRADLVNVDPAHSSIYLQELGNNNVSEGNIYNQPRDYYEVINNCNIYLAHVDSLLKAHGEYYYKNEIIGVKTFRAWCYLELAKIYGEVPLVTEPVIGSDAAENIVASGSKANLTAIADFCIDDLKGYAYEPKNNELRPSYSNDAKYSEYFIPVRVMLGELYLWRASMTGNESDYINAVRMYHNYLTFPNEEHVTGEFDVAWRSSSMGSSSDSYSLNLFDHSKEYTVAVLPMDTTEYNGYVTDLRAVFLPTYKQNYYPSVTIADRLDSISRNQRYCYYSYMGDDFIDTIYMSLNPADYASAREQGDLRLQSLLYTRSVSDKYNAALNKERTYIAKYTTGSKYIDDDRRLSEIPYYRFSTIYLHMAEALNRAGFPETAFAVLKYGLTEQVLMNRDIISADEFDRLGQIKVFGFSSTSTNYDEDHNNSFLVWPVSKFVTKNKRVMSSINGGIILDDNIDYQIGIHSFGSGDSEYNMYYSLPAILTNCKDITLPEEPVWNKREDADSAIYKAEYEVYVNDLNAYNLQDSINRVNVYNDSKEVRMDYVAKRILDEEALECCFEGTRFYDLMRYVRQQGDNSKTITMPAYIEEEYGKSSRNLTGKPWYLNLPKR